MPLQLFFKPHFQRQLTPAHLTISDNAELKVLSDKRGVQDASKSKKTKLSRRRILDIYWISKSQFVILHDDF